MNDIITYLKGLFGVITILISMLLMPGTSEVYTAERPDELKLSFSVVSDVHVESNNPDAFEAFRQVLRGIDANESSNTAIFLGDNTMNGQLIENSFLFGGLSTLKSTENVYMVLGNHDVGNGEGDYDELLTRFINYNNAFLKNKLDKPYYYKVVDGYYMIFLATEKHTVNTMYMSDEQLSWLEGVLNEADEGGNPIFVFTHHPLYAVDEAASDRLYALLEGHEELYYFHGHVHSYAKYMYGSIPCINLPRVTEVVDYDPGVGAVVEIYEDEVLIRTRNFVTGEWLETITFE